MEALEAQKLTEKGALGDLAAQVALAQEQQEQHEKLAADAQTSLAEATRVRELVIEDTAALRAELEAVQDEAAQPAADGSGDNALSLADICRAIQAAPGLNDATAAQRVELEQQLSNGVCAADALQTVFGTTNRQTLVSLIRERGPC